MITLAVVVSGLCITVVEAWPANAYRFWITGLYLGLRNATVADADQTEVDKELAAVIVTNAPAALKLIDMPLC
jgi:hypothetical protein